MNSCALLNSSNNTSLWVILLILIIGSFFSTITPPLQSPDEPAHLTRAYLLGKGLIILDAPEGKQSGGMIDSGLLDFYIVFAGIPFNPDRKLSLENNNSARSIKWTGSKIFFEIPGAGLYFPLIYLPQTIGLMFGEMFGLTIHTSYLLSKFMALISIALLLSATFKIYPANPLVIALLLIPMSVFQASSASIDGISTALSIFSIAAFLRLTSEKNHSGSWLFYAQSFSAVIVATCRPHLLPLLGLVLTTCFYIKKKFFFYIFVFALFFVLTWLFIASKTTVGFTDRVGIPIISCAIFYISNPLSLLNVLLNTLSNSDLVKFYNASFFGILGWLDTRFSMKSYYFLFVCTVLIGLFSISVRNLKMQWIPRIVLISSAIGSIFLIFFSLLITWNHHPAKIIDGVQGRYFIVPMLMVAYALSEELGLTQGIYRKIAIVLLMILGTFTLMSTPKLLIERYYLAPEPSKTLSVEQRPSAPLEKNNPITLFMSTDYKTNPQPLKRIGINFGTHVRKNPGVAELRLTTSNNEVLTIPFDLPTLSDNQYKYFELNAKPYSSGQIQSLTGGGISTWEVRQMNGTVETCLIFEYPNGKKLYTQGCPID